MSTGHGQNRGIRNRARPERSRARAGSGAVRGPERAPWGRPRAGPRTRREPELRRRAARIPSAAAQGPQSRLGQCPERAGRTTSGQPRSGPCSNLKRVARKRIPRGTPRVRGGRCPWRCLVVKHKERHCPVLRVLASQRTSKHPLCEAQRMDIAGPLTDVDTCPCGTKMLASKVRTCLI